MSRPLFPAPPRFFCRALRVALAALSVLSFLIAADSAAAEEPKPFIELRWSLGADGELLVAPHPQAQEPAERLPLLHDHATRRESVAPFFSRSGIGGFLQYALHGGLDLASLTDVETYFAKLHGGFDARRALDRPPADPNANPSPGQTHRAALDRLAAVRMCGLRRLATAKPTLKKIADNPTEERLLRDAAAQSLKLIEGEPPPDVATDLAPLAEALKLLPAKSDLLLVLRPHLAPLWRRPGATLRHFTRTTFAEIVGVTDRQNMTIPRAVILEGELMTDVAGQMNFEFARLLGNHRWDRCASSVRFAENDSTVLSSVSVLDGVFSPALLRAALRREGWTQEPDGTLSLKTSANGVWTLVVEEKRAVARFRRLEFDDEEPRLTDADVEVLRVPCDDLVWLRLTNASTFTARTPHTDDWSWLKKARAAGVRVFTRQNELHAEFSATYPTEKEAVELTAATLPALSKILSAGLRASAKANDYRALDKLCDALERASFSANGETCLVKLHVESATPESLLEIMTSVSRRRTVEK